MTDRATAEPYSSAYTEADLTDTTHQDSRRLTPSQAADIVHDHPGFTSRELAEATGKDRWMIARRLPEAANDDQPRIRRGEPRTCKISDRRAITWWPV